MNFPARIAVIEIIVAVRMKGQRSVALLCPVLSKAFCILNRKRLFSASHCTSLGRFMYSRSFNMGSAAA